MTPFTADQAPADEDTVRMARAIRGPCCFVLIFFVAIHPHTQPKQKQATRTPMNRKPCISVTVLVLVILFHPVPGGGHVAFSLVQPDSGQDEIPPNDCAGSHGR